MLLAEHLYSINVSSATHLSYETGLCQCGVEDVVDVYRKELQETLATSGGYSVRRMIRIRPCVRAV